MALIEPNKGVPERDRWLDELYTHTRLEEPPPKLDHAIRAAARKDVGARPRALGAHLRRWQLPVSIAAVVVISASMVILMREEGADRFEEALAPKPVQEKAAAPAPHGDADLKQRDSADAPTRLQAPATRIPAAPKAGLTLPPAEETQRAARPDAPSVGRVRPAQPFPGEMRQRAADAANEGVARAPVSAAEAPEKIPPRAATGVMSAPRTKGETAELLERETSGKRAVLESERLLSEDRYSQLVDQLKESPPEEWLEKITALRQQGRNDEADRLLAEFRRRYPHHPVPERGDRLGN